MWMEDKAGQSWPSPKAPKGRTNCEVCEEPAGWVVKNVDWKSLNPVLGIRKTTSPLLGSPVNQNSLHPPPKGLKDVIVVSVKGLPSRLWGAP